MADEPLLSAADQAARFDPGEDAAPLLRSLLAAFSGLVGALFIDRLVPNGPTWFRLAQPFVGDGLWSILAWLGSLALVAALVYTYGQVRRFLLQLAPPVAGVVWVLVLWLAVGPAFLVRATWIAPNPSAFMATMVAACLVTLETTTGLVWLGLAIGWLCRRRQN